MDGASLQQDVGKEDLKASSQGTLDYSQVSIPPLNGLLNARGKTDKPRFVQHVRPISVVVAAIKLIGPRRFIASMRRGDGKAKVDTLGNFAAS
jgi:hypothetical protein